ncbi:MAG: TIGR04255 family protein [bacterium]
MKEVSDESMRSGDQTEAPEAESIVEFDNPPVAEVVLSVAFEPLQGLTLAKLVQSWQQHFAEKFPESEEQPRLQPPIERFGPDRLGPGLRFEFGGTLPTSRLWFLDKKEGTNLLQVQNDWFARNWRKQESAEYIRYKTLRAAFADEFSTFRDFVIHEGIGTLMPTQCEITYIDHIEPNEYWSSHEDARKVFRILNLATDRFLPTSPEDCRFAMSFVIPGDAEQPIGRLHINAQPAFRKTDDQPIFVVNTTARGAPADDSLDGILHFLDHGHEWAVNGFLDVTTDEMHTAWGIRDD